VHPEQHPQDTGPAQQGPPPPGSPAPPLQRPAGELNSFWTHRTDTNRYTCCLIHTQHTLLIPGGNCFGVLIKMERLSDKRKICLGLFMNVNAYFQPVYMYSNDGLLIQIFLHLFVHGILQGMGSLHLWILSEKNSPILS